MYFLLVFLPVPYEIGDRAVVAALAGLRKEAAGNLVAAPVIFDTLAADALARARFVGAGTFSHGGAFLAFHKNPRK